MLVHKKKFLQALEQDFTEDESAELNEDDAEDDEMLEQHERIQMAANVECHLLMTDKGKAFKCIQGEGQSPLEHWMSLQASHQDVTSDEELLDLIKAFVECKPESHRVNPTSFFQELDFKIEKITEANGGVKKPDCEIISHTMTSMLEECDKVKTVVKQAWTPEQREDLTRIKDTHFHQWKSQHHEESTGSAAKEENVTLQMEAAQV